MFRLLPYTLLMVPVISCGNNNQNASPPAISLTFFVLYTESLVGSSTAVSRTGAILLCQRGTEASMRSCTFIPFLAVHLSTAVPIYKLVQHVYWGVAFQRCVSSDP